MNIDKGDSTQAEVYVNRILLIKHKVINLKIETELRFKRANTECADNKRDFVRAA